MIRELKFDLIKLDTGRWQWECEPVAGVTAYSNPSTLKAAESSAGRFARAMGRKCVIVESEAREAAGVKGDNDG